MNYRKIRAIVVVCMAILILLYVCFSVVDRRLDAFSNSKITTEAALYGEVSDFLQAQGFAVREENVIESSYSGVLNYRVGNGTRISTGGVIADVFVSESDAAAQNRADRLEREINSLSALAKPLDRVVSASTSAGDQIYDSLSGILLDVQRNDFSGVTKYKEDLLIALSRKQVISGAETAEDYAQRVLELEQEKDRLTVEAGHAVESITSPEAGYFIGATDGFETVVDVEDMMQITPDKVEKLLAMENGGGTLSSVGKICSDFKWYLVCLFSDMDMVKFEGIEEVSLDIPFASTATIPARIVAKNRNADSGKTAVVFECTYMDADIAMVRNETVQVNVKTYSGVLVNEKALHFCDVEYTETDEAGNTVTKVKENVKGVYVMYGGQLHFVQIFSEKDVNGYAVCKTELTEQEQESLVTERTVQLYDQVVIGGVDLYDGKLVD
ncbi:HlyD family efflux transporter periplasmic adaptor subunit [Acutalibacter caecimuris]|uniref:HlyD family efflux transporter periplasmic adaptor subunit n=1 Tax=Acutalibacter caecimuris TaxID=3093657 RepID=UPI002AC9125A|nr:HlyD family efflux transporter periplasmic adaptor subunit [Acutalibacter sp. M00118]